MGWLKLRIGPGNGKPAHWASISKQGNGPQDADRLRLKRDDGRWVAHAAPREPGAEPVRLHTPKGWETALYLSPVSNIAEWGETNRFSIKRTRYVRGDEYIIRDPNASDTMGGSLKYYDEDWYDHNTPGLFREYEQCHWTVDVGVIKRAVPAGLRATKLHIEIITDIGSNITPDPEFFPYRNYNARLYETTGREQLVKEVSGLGYQDLVSNKWVNLSGVSHWTIQDAKFGFVGDLLAEYNFKDDTYGSGDHRGSWRGFGYPRLTYTRTITEDELPLLDHLEYAIVVDEVQDPPVQKGAFYSLLATCYTNVYVEGYRI